MSMAKKPGPQHVTEKYMIVNIFLMPTPQTVTRV
jgi:hypothetical protein